VTHGQPPWRKEEWAQVSDDIGTIQSTNAMAMNIANVTRLFDAYFQAGQKVSWATVIEGLLIHVITDRLTDPKI
jgi:hypothetical protein